MLSCGVLLCVFDMCSLVSVCCGCVVVFVMIVLCFVLVWVGLCLGLFGCVVWCWLVVCCVLRFACFVVLWYGV